MPLPQSISNQPNKLMSIKQFKEDDYLASSAYQNKAKSSVDPAFSVFSQDGQAYFALEDSQGNLILRSEGYASEAARNNGIESVLKNKADADKWSVAEKMGYYFLVLKAANHQEIGRSGSFKSKEEAEASLGSYMSSGNLVAAATNNLASSTHSNGHHDVLKSEDKEDDYLPCKEYQGHPVNDKENNVALFKHDNGQFYFVLYNSAGDVKIRSEGFETAKNRDQELSGVLKYHNDDNMYTVLQKGKYSMMVLKDKNGTEVGRSCLIKEENNIEATENTLAVSETGKVISSKVVSTTRVAATEDDYMKCDAYKGHPVTDTENNIALFTSNDELYFVVYDSAGDVRLRSEGFKTEAGRDNELNAVIEHMNNPDMYSVIKKGNYSIKVLKDSIGREVGRSCLYLDV